MADSINEVPITAKEFHDTRLDRIKEFLDECNIIEAARDINDFASNIALDARSKEITSEDYRKYKNELDQSLRIARGKCFCNKK